MLDSATQLVDLPGNPQPEGTSAGYVTTPDGIRLRFAYWRATASPLKGTITLLQGRAEFIEKYFETVNDLRSRGYAVVTFDWRGQGGSERLLNNPRRGHVDDFSDYLTDLDTMLTNVTLANLPGPHFALAHSTGGAIILHGTERLATRLERAVLTSPLIGLGRIGWPPAIVSPLAHALSGLGFGTAYVPGGSDTIRQPFEGNWLSHDERRYERMHRILDAAPHLEIGAPTVDWLAAASRAMKQFASADFGPSMRLAVLMIGAGNDRIVSTRAIEQLAKRTRSARYLEIPGARHELLMESDFYRDQALEAMDAFFSNA
ncbi:alpha/beta hydrolase [Rhizobiales bacterium]|uniref:alpha/beta fold hydrolase n=1 Tax=Hongsoonwoonella zoysiae TaxID=2821844 RepID=UPI00155FD5A5|nr:alpha/beta hydrolase [Hongsoonwoonella zoysiae]NRG17326.1 alpha/beta hydrolase [Hongsoonwoonella zoysiae]